MSDNRVVFGLSNAHYAIWDEDTESYGTPVEIPGSVSLSITAEGSTDTFYADNIPYAAFTTNGGYTGELEVATLEDDVFTNLLGYQLDTNGMIIEDASAELPTWALLFEVSSNTRPQRYVFYNCVADRPDVEANTKTDSTDPDTVTLPITMITRTLSSDYGDIDAVKASVIKSDDTEDVYEAWYDAVTLPTTTASE